jgi:iron(III) transport system substrate-binding protein
LRPQTLGALLKLSQKISLAGVAIATILAGSLVPAAHAAEALQLYAALDYSTDVATAFTAKTGIPVEVTALSTGPLLAKITAEKNNPKWGVYWADGAEPCAAFDIDKQLLHYKTKGAHLNAIGAQLAPKTMAYQVPGFTEMVGVVYNSSKVRKPTSWDDLASSDFKNQVGMNNPSVSGPTYPFLAGLMQQFGGVDAMKSYLLKMKANGMRVFDKNSKTIAAMETGVVNVGLVQSSAAISEVAKIKAKPVAGLTPAVTFLSKTTVLPSCLAIDGKASTFQQDAAKKFADFVMTTDAVNIMTKSNFGDSLFWPTLVGRNPAPATLTMPSIASGLVQFVDPYKYAPIQGDIQDWFTKNIA